MGACLHPGGGVDSGELGPCGGLRQEARWPLGRDLYYLAIRNAHGRELPAPQGTGIKGMDIMLAKQTQSRPVTKYNGLGYFAGGDLKPGDQACICLRGCPLVAEIQSQVATQHITNPRDDVEPVAQAFITAKGSRPLCRLIAE